jgi:hypothetical protein
MLVITYGGSRLSMLTHALYVPMESMALAATRFLFSLMKLWQS